MDYRKAGFGLGVFSLALGAAELFASQQIGKALEAEDSTGLIKAFGARELVAGLALVAAPAVSTNVWARVAGDVMDLTALGAAAQRAQQNRVVWGTLAFVVAVTVLDVVVARGLDRTTGKMLPARA